MTADPMFGVELALWLFIAIAVALYRSRSHQLTVGLTAAYMVNLWLIHWPAAFTYLLPWYLPVDGPAVLAGFEQSLIAIFGFAVGVVAVGPIVSKALKPPRAHSEQAAQRAPHAGLPYVYVFVGFFAYFVVIPLMRRVPTFSAVVTGVGQLIVAGMCLLLWHAWFAKRKRLFVTTVIAACSIPLITILRDGFLASGAAAVIAIIAFLTVFVRPRWVLAIVLVAVAYIGFSFYVTYMRDRNDLRAAIWGGEPVAERTETLSNTITNIEWFDPHDPEHLMRINSRLNQNYIVGMAVQNLSNNKRDFAHGQTVFEAFLSLVPRAIWLDKPTRAGSGDLVTRFTGIHYAAGTSVGIGQVMEFYVNFGTVGVVLGFVLFGAVLFLFDTWAAQRLWSGDWLQFTVWFLPGLSMMQAGGSLVEVLSSSVASIAAALLVNRYIGTTRMGRLRHVPAGVRTH